MRRIAGRLVMWFAGRVMLGLANWLSCKAFSLVVWSWSLQKTTVEQRQSALPPFKGEVIYEAPPEDEEDTDPDVKGLN